MLRCVSTTPPPVPPLPSMSRLGSFLSPPRLLPLPLVLFPTPSGIWPRTYSGSLLAFPSPFSLSCGRGGWSGAVVALGSRRKGGQKKQCFLSVAGGSPVARSLKPCSSCIRALLLCGQTGYGTRAPFWGVPNHFEVSTFAEL